MSEERAEAEGREPLAFIKAFESVAIDPSDGLLMGPGVAVPRLLERTGLGLSDVDIIEVHEAFGGQVACNLRAWETGWKEPAIGIVDRARLDPLGSSIGVGLPVGEFESGDQRLAAAPRELDADRAHACPPVRTPT